MLANLGKTGSFWHNEMLYPEMTGPLSVDLRVRESPSNATPAAEARIHTNLIKE